MLCLLQQNEWLCFMSCICDECSNMQAPSQVQYVMLIVQGNANFADTAKVHSLP